MSEVKENKLSDLDDYSLSGFFASDGFITINKLLIKVFDLETAVFISELFSMYDNEDIVCEDDWLYVTAEYIENDTGLTRYAQDKCIDKLEKMNILYVKKEGMPLRRYFKINSDELLDKIIECSNSK